MRTLLKVTMSDVEAANKAIQKDRVGAIVGKVSEQIQPETTYFYAEQGHRTALFVFDLKDTSDIPAIAEQFFIGLNAKVEFFPVMNKDELAQGIEKWKKSQ